MKFYGRDDELAKLAKTREHSLQSSTFTVITGRRRIGKTTLMLKSAENHRHVYLFVSRTTESILCSRLQESAMEAGVDIVGNVTEFRDLFKALMLDSKREPLTVIIDEFQELNNVNPGIFSSIQEIWDRYHKESRMNLLVGGSVHSMMVRLFEDEKQPLFGRATSKIVLRPFKASLLKDILIEYNPNAGPRDLLMLYMLTGGVPRYVGTLVDGGNVNEKSMLDAALSEGSIFLSDGRDILLTELGKDHRVHLSILGLISSGKDRRSQIDDILGMETGPYLKKLESEYQFIRHRTPVFSKPESRNMQWEIVDPYLRFYFRFIEPSMAYLESRRYDLLMRYIERGLEEYEERSLEDLLRKKVSEEWMYTEVGGYWNRKGDVKIDLAVIDSIDRKATFIEVKRNPSKIDIGSLSRKVSTLDQHLHGYDVELKGMSMDDLWS